MTCIKQITILLCASLFLLLQKTNAQFVSLNGAYISISSSTVVSADTINNNSSSTVANAGTLTLNTLTNAGTSQGNGTYNIAKGFDNTGTFTANSSTVSYNGNSNQTITALTYNNLAVAGTGSTKTAAGNTIVNGLFIINSGDTLDMATYTLGGTLTPSGIGLFKTQNTSSTPIPTGKTWTGPVYYNSSSAQYIKYGNYTDLNGSGGARTLDAATTGISGTFTPGSGTYTTTGSNIDFNGSAQTIPAFAFNNLTLSGASTKTLGGAVSLIDSLTLGASTTLALSSYDFTLKSTASTVARIANTPSSATITYGTGRFIAERYVQGRRKYRLMTSSVTSSPNSTLIAGEESLSIWGNWQNAGDNTTANVGTLITGGTSADGFDQGSQTPSMYDYDDINKKYVAHSTANGKNTKYTPLKAGIAYYLFVYGDRLNTVNATSPHNTELPSKGKVLMGDQTYSTSSTIPLTGVTNRFTMLGNPFASPIDWATVSRTNISNTFWGWDPNLNSTGGYVTVSSTGAVTLISPYSGSVGLNQYIQPGQGFFVKTTGGSPTMTIHESDKVPNFNSIAFRGSGTNSPTVNSIPLIAVNLQYSSAGNMILADGTLAAFDPSFSNSVGNEDGTKIAGAAEVIAVQNGPDLLSIEARKMPADLDTIFLNVQRITKPQYTLQIFTNQMVASGRQPYLVDNYLSTTQIISLTDTTNVVFNVTAGVPASSAANRFSIVFHDVSILPISFISINAVQKNKDVEVDWSVAEESTARKYEVERSSNGIAFSKVGEVSAKAINGNVSYLWLDHQPMSGKNFYRVRAVNADGKYLLSKIAWVNIDAASTGPEPSIKVYPNPVIGQQFNLQLSDMPKGDYTVQLLNVRGQVVFTKNITHNGGTTSQVIPITKSLAAGIYLIKVVNGLSGYSQSIKIN